MVLENRDSFTQNYDGGATALKHKIQNELLCYACHKMDVMPNALLVKTLSEFYNEDEIWTAKEVVFDKLSPSTRNIKRKGADKKQQNVIDILDVLHKADPDDIPMFEAFDLNRLPSMDMNSVYVTSM